MLLRDTDIKGGEAIAIRIACAITTLGIAHEGNRPWGVVTVSSGVAGMDPASLASGDCVANADAAMYRSKRSGRNTVATYEPEPNLESPESQEPSASQEPPETDDR